MKYFLITAIVVNTAQRRAEDCSTVSCSLKIVQTDNRFNGKFITVPIMVSVIASFHAALSWYHFTRLLLKYYWICLLICLLVSIYYPLDWKPFVRGFLLVPSLQLSVFQFRPLPSPFLVPVFQMMFNQNAELLSVHVTFSNNLRVFRVPAS